MTIMHLTDGTEVSSGAVVYDPDSKDFVKVTNGTCTLDHATPAGFAESHKGGQCRYTPCEGAALRCVGLDDKGRPVVAFTYRKIDPSRVTLARDYRWPDMSGTKPRGLFIGRI